MENFLSYGILAFVVIFLILGYVPIIKKYLPRRSKYTSGGFAHIVCWYKSTSAILTLILPFVRVRSSANLPVLGENSMQIRVKALGAKRAECTNRRQLEQMGYRVTQNINLRATAIQRGGRTIIIFSR